MDVLDEDNTIPIRKTAGMVFQNPDNQIIASVVEEDVGFGPENLGVPTDEIWKRVEDSLKSVGMISYLKPLYTHLTQKPMTQADLVRLYFNIRETTEQETSLVKTNS